MGAGDRIRELLAPLFEESGKEMRPADGAAVEALMRRLAKMGVPPEAAEQLADLYRVTDGVPCLDSLDIHACGDDILFEWEGEGVPLWIGQRDMDSLMWADGRFRLGDASGESYGEEYEFESLAGLLEAALGYRRGPEGE
ncbi:MAG: glycerol-3-phosphate dehydrogenase/oxidase [Methanomassiliicoccaceae archaeon]|nr:glycerol-3-phosphate dehydrogenase/oxidase [Methanomassiliicoccaceae archaeon]